MGKRLLGQAIRALAYHGCRLVQAHDWGHPVSLGGVQRLRRLVPVRNGLAARGHGSWTLDEEALSFFLAEIARRRPAWVLEFGSGTSTVRIARALTEVAGGLARLYSIEQEQSFANETLRRLDEEGLRDHVRLVCRPLHRQVVAGRETLCYELPPAFIERLLPDEGEGLILIDGPAGAGDVRFGTLPLVQPALKQPTPFYLHDALRDDELKVAEAWQELDGITIRGIWVVGEGLLAGEVSGAFRDSH